jgi:hypothetical protein
MKDWTRHFGDPIPMPDGGTIRTIGEAARYAAKLPKRIGDTEPWQRAASDLAMASEHAAYVFFARISFYRAVYGDDVPPIGKRRMTKAEQFKAKRAALKRKKSPATSRGR